MPDAAFDHFMAARDLPRLEQVVFEGDLRGLQAAGWSDVKGNQPKLRAQIAALPWRDVPVTSDTRERGHLQKLSRIRPASGTTM